MTTSLSRQLIYGPTAGDIDHLPPWLANSISLFREGKILHTHLLLSAYSSDCAFDLKPDVIWLDIQCLHSLRYYSKVPGLIKSLSLIVQADDSRILHATLQYLLNSNSSVDFKYILPSCNLDSRFTEFPHLLISAINSCLIAGNINEADLLLEKLLPVESLFVALVRAKVAKEKGNHILVESILLPKLDEYIYDREYCEILINTLFSLRRESLCMPVLRKCIEFHHTLSSTLLSRFSEAKLLQRQPADGLRFKLLERINNSVGAEQQSPTCLSTAYDLLGRSEWLKYIHPEIILRPGMAAHLASNLMMHSSSQALSSYPELAKNLNSFLYSQWRSIGEKCIGPYPKKIHSDKLKVGWILGDVCNHPVFRFVYSFFYASQGHKKHDHCVVATHAMNRQYTELLLALSDISLVDFSHIKTMPEQLRCIRSQEFDVVIDLNGWTANNIAPVFLARVAPLQVNYLAYHASSGIPSMDVWIVDDNLIPLETSSQEWHTEKIVRLSRPFLAWQPPFELPEGKIKTVTPIAFDKGSPIRFGSFNNMRKISDSCLQLWSKLLKRVPNSILVLKAFASEDENTAFLIKQRLIDAEIDINRIHFLPFTSTPDEHLMQYAYLDVALDSFPNTGCTTTCEALWMGVPVLTLYGEHYVTRMAYAVLCGAGLSDWSFSNSDDYLGFAVSLAENKSLTWLRSNRAYWREKITSSMLGDSKDLMQQLESTFLNLHDMQTSSLDSTAER